VLDGIDYAISRRQMLARTIAALSVAGLPEWFYEGCHSGRERKGLEASKEVGPNDQINVAPSALVVAKGGYRQVWEIHKESAASTESKCGNLRSGPNSSRRRSE